MASPNGLAVATNHMYLGRPFNELVMRYGQPTSRMSYGDETVYHFRTAVSAGAHAYSVGYVGSSAAVDVSRICTMRVSVNAANRVEGVDFTGSASACAIFMP